MKPAAIACAVAVAAASACLTKPDRPGDGDGDAPTANDGAPTDGPVSPADGAGDAAGSCPKAYNISHPASPSRYRRGSSATWDQANADCLDDGAVGGYFTHLVVLGGDIERDLVAQMIGGSAWIGRSDRRLEGDYVWNTDETNYELGFTRGEPNDGTNGNCIWMSGAGEARDEPCSTTIQSYCECDTSPDDPSNYTP